MITKSAILALFLSGGSALAQTLDGSWSACDGSRLLILGNTFEAYTAYGEPMDSGLLSPAPGGMILMQSRSGGTAVLQIYDERLYLLGPTGEPQVKLSPSHPTPARDACECVAYEDYAFCIADPEGYSGMR